MGRSEMALIGRVRGPGPSRHSFSVVAFDRHTALDSGEFVTCPIAGRLVLARLVERRPLRPYPDSFLTAPELEPQQVAAAVGYSEPQPPPVELVAELIGAFDPALQDFINPRRLPEVGAPVSLAGHDQLSQLLNRRQPGQPGAAHLGWLLSREPGAVPVVLDVAALTSTHLAIIASTGAGKSYLAGVLVEELLGPHNRAAILLLDPHGEYGSLAALTGQPHRPQVAVHQPGSLKIRTGSLSLADLRYLLPDLSERMEYVLGQAYRQCRQGDGWSLAGLRQAIAAMAEPEAGKKSSSYRETANALLCGLTPSLRTPSCLMTTPRCNCASWSGRARPPSCNSTTSTAASSRCWSPPCCASSTGPGCRPRSGRFRAAARSTCPTPSLY